MVSDGTVSDECCWPLNPWVGSRELCTCYLCIKFLLDILKFAICSCTVLSHTVLSTSTSDLGSPKDIYFTEENCVCCVRCDAGGTR